MKISTSPKETIKSEMEQQTIKKKKFDFTLNPFLGTKEILK